MITRSHALPKHCLRPGGLMDARVIQFPTREVPGASARRGRRGREPKREKSSFGSVQRLPSGRFQARYASPTDGRRVAAPRTFDDAATAWAWLKSERPFTEAPETWVPPKERLRQAVASQETLRVYA